MSVEFDPQSDESDDEVLVGPERHSRRWIAVVSAGAAVALVGGAVVLAANGSSASPVSIAAAASSASTSTGTPAAKPTGTDGRRALPVAPVAPFLYGTVKSVTGTKIVITDLQGFARTIITSSKTTYKDGLTSSPAVGAKILAAGTIATDGTSLDATTMSSPKLPEGFGGQRPGGAGGPGVAGAPGGKGSGGPAHPGPRGPVAPPTKTS